MSETPRINIAICMGSSCFTRGNNRNLEVIQQYLKTHGLAPKAALTGHLCQDHCKSGPNVLIDGQMHHEVDPMVIVGLIQQQLPPGTP